MGLAPPDLEVICTPHSSPVSRNTFLPVRCQLQTLRGSTLQSIDDALVGPVGRFFLFLMDNNRGRVSFQEQFQSVHG
jgi:hypothetical protein